MTQNPNVSQNDNFGFLVDAALVFLGVWTIVHEIAYFIGLSFRQNWNLAIVAGCLSVVAFHRHIKKGPRLLFEKAPLQDRLVLWVSIITAMILTACLYRPDADDEFYLGLSVMSLDFIDRPIKTLPILKESAYALTCYDFLRAAFSHYTGVPLLSSYYLDIPALASILVIISQYRLYRLIGIQNIALAFISFFVIMLAWGDVHRSPANLGFVKLFQGKGLLVWISIPANLYYWLRYHTTLNSTYLVLLVLTSISAIGFSATGIPIIFISFFLMSASSLVSNKHLFRDRKVILLLASGLACLATVAVVVITVFHHKSTGIHTAQGMRTLNSFSDHMVNIEMLHFVLGDSPRAWFALLSLALTPFILKDTPYKKPFSLYITACLFLMAFPFTSALFGLYINESMSWRWLFLLPFVPCMVLVIDKLYSQAVIAQVKLSAGLPALVLILFYWSSHSLISDFNHTQFSYPKPKTPDPNNIVLRYYPDVHAHTEGSYLVSPVTGKLH